MADHVATTFQISYWKQFIGVWREIAAPPVDTKLFIPPLSNFGIHANVIGYTEWACRLLGNVWRRLDWKPMEVSTWKRGMNNREAPGLSTYMCSHGVCDMPYRRDMQHSFLIQIERTGCVNTVCNKWLERSLLAYLTRILSTVEFTRFYDDNVIVCFGNFYRTLPISVFHLWTRPLSSVCSAWTQKNVY